MDKRNLLHLLPAFILVLLWLFWPESEENKKVHLLKEQAHRAALAANPQSGEHREFIEQNKKLFTEENMYSFSQLLEMARTGHLSLVAELWKLRGRCGVGAGNTVVGTDKDVNAATLMNYDECNIRIENFLREQYAMPDNERIVTLFRNYVRYEDTMRRFQLPENISASERYDILKKKRREFFSEADAKLIFGYEEARTVAQDAVSEFFKNSTAMSADQRVKKYFEIRKHALGDYNAAFNESEPVYTRYETEMLLHSDEMQRTGNSAAQTQTMREKYFGSEGAKRMAQVDREIQQERTRIDSYEVTAQKLLRENSSLSEAEKKMKLSELRESMLGKEEADAYERRMQYEEYLRSNNLK